jgi:hypothetical protein
VAFSCRYDVSLLHAPLELAAKCYSQLVVTETFAAIKGQALADPTEDFSVASEDEYVNFIVGAEDEYPNRQYTRVCCSPPPRSFPPLLPSGTPSHAPPWSARRTEGFASAGGPQGNAQRRRGAATQMAAPHELLTPRADGASSLRAPVPHLHQNWAHVCRICAKKFTRRDTWHAERRARRRDTWHAPWQHGAWACHGA